MATFDAKADQERIKPLRQKANIFPIYAIDHCGTRHIKITASTVNRTRGLKIFSLALSQLSYRSEKRIYYVIHPMWGLNPRPHD